MSVTRQGRVSNEGSPLGFLASEAITKEVLKCGLLPLMFVSPECEGQSRAAFIPPALEASAKGRLTALTVTHDSGVQLCPSTSTFLPDFKALPPSTHLITAI